MNFRAALVAEGYCQEVGFESPAAGKFCRTKGVTPDEIKRFSTWLAQHDDDVVLSASARTREQERINKVTALSEEQKQQNRELQRLALIGTGILNSTPLVAYTYATNYLALNLLGFCQYISPILTLVLGIFVYQESFGWEKIYPMLFVWLGIVLFIFGQRKIRRFQLNR